jgi:hypothetical protein
VTAYPPECYSDAQVAAGRAHDDAVAAANEADAIAAHDTAAGGEEPL